MDKLTCWQYFLKWLHLAFNQGSSMRTVFPFIFLAVLFLLPSCSVYEYMPPPVKVVESEEFTWIIAKQMAKWKHEKGRRLKLEHSQLHYNLQGVSWLRLELSSQEILEVDDARDLFVDFVEDLLQRVNSSPLAADQIADYPFTADNLSIEINFESYFGYYVDPFYVGCISMEDGIVRYNAFDLKDQEWYSWHSRVEPYTKSREVSLITRAADKEYREERSQDCPNYLDNYFPLDPCPLIRF